MQNSYSFYLQPNENFRKLEARSEKYRFNLEQDVEWQAANTDGDFFTPELLEDSGIDLSHPALTQEILNTFQWALAVAICDEFVILEKRILQFLEEESSQGRLPDTRSVSLFETEEIKHVELFSRLSSSLKSQRPELAAQLDKKIISSLETAWWYQDNESNYPSTAIYHYVCWLHFLYFEEYSIYLFQRLKRGKNIQSTWLSANAAHSREEAQHIKTDAGFIERLDLTDSEKATWGQWFIEQTSQDASGLAGLEGVWDFISDLYPQLKSLPLPVTLVKSQTLKRQAFYRLITYKNAFLNTRNAAYFTDYEKNLFNTHQITELDLEKTQDSSRPLSQSQNDHLNTICQLLAKALDVDVNAINPDSHILHYGLDSVKAMNLATELESTLNVSLSPSIIFEFNTIRELAESLKSETATDDNELEKAEENHQSIIQNNANNFSNEEQVKPKNQTTLAPHSQQQVFLTGATGFLCVYVLHELLADKNVTVHCLVRSNNEEQAIQRINDNLARFNLPTINDTQRIRVVLGDLEKPQLGLDKANYQQLIDNIDYIIHGAALVDFILPYKSLRKINEEGTREIIRIAIDAGKVPLHHISTVAVFDTQGDNTHQQYTESDSPEQAHGFRSGYGESKWRAEQLINDAQRFGLPATIYRVGIVTGDSDSGAVQPDLFSNLIKCFINEGIAIDPLADGSISAVPVNYAAKAIASLAKNNRDEKSQVFHITHSSPLKWRKFYQHLNTLGYKVDPMPYDQWLNKIRERASEKNSKYLSQLAAYFSGRQNQWDIKIPEITSKVTTQTLQENAVEFPKFDQQLLKTYINYFGKTGFLETN